QAGFVKIDFLALGALSQMQDALQLVEQRTGSHLDLSRIDHNDSKVYKMLHEADTIGIFQVESAAQMQTITRIRPGNLFEMAYEVAAVRPGVGANDGVTQFIRRYTRHEPWDYDHPLERRALERTCGVILFQDQVNQLAMDVAGFSSMEADRLRRAFTWRRDRSLLERHWDRFRDGALSQGVSEEAARRVFEKFNGQYMFPESHAFAFGVTAYHMSWLKYYYPLEFYVAIFNQQPMGFYNLETLKEDAKNHGIRVLNPDINLSWEQCVIHDESLLLGFLKVRDVGTVGASALVQAREEGGPFTSLADAVQRTGLPREALERLVLAGAFDSLTTDRRAALWEIGLRYCPGGYQQPLNLPVQQDMAQLPLQTEWEGMAEEHATLSLYPQGHLMSFIRPSLDPRVLNSQEILNLAEGAEVTVAGLVIRRQRPHARAVFITLEDEVGHIPLVVWPQEYEKFKHALREPVLMMRGIVSRRDDTFNIVVKEVRPVPTLQRNLPKAKNWQ
ncbi:MAG: OB-fold nucleic acid binding domain-containing protein, partial [Dehalococcoidia bacterium]